MPKIKFLATWCTEWIETFGIPKGYILLKYDQSYRKNLGKVLLKLDQYQQKVLEREKEINPNLSESDYLRPLEIEIEYHYRKRTLDQNALMWSLYEIEANEMNGGQQGHSDQIVTPMELYLADVDEWGEREIITTKRKNYSYYIEEYKIIEAVILNDNKEISIKEFLRMQIDNNDRISLRVIRGTSKLNAKEMTQWIERIFNRMAYHGLQVTNPGEIESYWIKHKQFINDNKIVLHDTIMTQQEYKDLNPLCEACMKYIADGTGELAHIKSIGMGCDRSKEPARNYSSNQLHLCIKCHRDIWHGKGVKAFLNLFKHLIWKVKTALNRDYLEIEEDKYVAEKKN